jgi:hypothetical protein
LGVALTGSARTEFDAIDETGREVVALPTFTGKPVAILVARDTPNGDELARDIAEKRADFASLYPGSEWQQVDSGHLIQKEKPQIVIDTIRKVLAQARTGRPPATRQR